MEILERFLKYVSFDTTSNSNNEYNPSTKNQLEFAKYLSENEIFMWIRQVIVPGITDDERDIKKLKEFVNGLKTPPSYENRTKNEIAYLRIGNFS